MGKYDKIINLPHHVSSTHPHMSMIDRAAQFSPFAALTGYDAAVKETARLTEQKIELDEYEKAALDQRILLLQEHLKELPEVTITHFVPDERKDGGKYFSITEAVKKIKKQKKNRKNLIRMPIMWTTMRIMAMSKKMMMTAPFLIVMTTNPCN